MKVLNTKNVTTVASMLAIAMMLSVSFTPTAFAKEGKGWGEKKEDKKEQSEHKKEKKNNKDDKNDDRKCYRAFGHFIAPGWIKKNGTSTVDTDCWFPFGIGKKIRDNHNGGNNGTSTATTTPDITAPTITTVASTTRETEARITWKTNEKADGAIYFSTSTPISTSSSTTPAVFRSELVKEHSITLTNLTASTTYSFIVRSRDASGNTTFSDTMTFTTKPHIVVVDTTAPTISNAVAIVSTSTISVSWKTNEPATTKLYRGTSTPVSTTASSTVVVEDVALNTNHTISMSGLATSTLYYAMIESKDASGNTQTSDTFSFTTSAGI